jgi:hypothetical protein
MAEIPPLPPWALANAENWDADAPSVQAAEPVEPKPGHDPKTGRFLPGFSGNPNGKAKSRYRATMLEGIESVINVVRTAALAGDMQAAALLLGRTLPPLKAEADTVEFELDTNTSVVDQCKQVLKAAADGKISFEQAKQFVELIGTVKDIGDVENALDELKRLKRRGQSTNQPSGVRFAPIEDFIKGTVQ